ncbi:hypothetical protein N5I28_08105, partial [Pseudomonas mosselii]|uniref:hypothetical protein n=1 Tax=Pseudomonas mosselii TaxID=78327 RepID=UPI002449CFFA
LFSALGWESHYYAFYSPLCDSVHSFSDEMSALVDFSDLYSISEAEAEKSLTYWNKERLRLAIYHFVVAIGLRTEAFSRCCSSLAPDLHEISSEGLLIKINTPIMRHDLFDHSRLREMESGMAKPDEFVINI